MKPRTLPWWLLVLGALSAVGGTVPFYLHANFNDVHVVNGLPVKVRVAIGDHSIDVAPGKREVLSNVPVGAHRVEVTGSDGALEDRSLVYVRGAGRLLIYNVSGAAAVVSQRIEYSSRPTNREAPHHVHCGERLIELDDIDYAFTEPPHQISVDRKSGVITKRAVQVIAGGVQACQSWVYEQGKVELLGRWAEQAGQPDSAVWVASLFGDARGVVAVLDAKLKAGSGSPGDHRVLQNFFELAGEEAAILPRYRARAEAPDATDLDLYLYARLLPVEQKLPVLLLGAQRFPQSPWLRWSLCYSFDLAGDPARALAECDALAKLGVPPELEETVAEKRMSLLLELGRVEDAFTAGQQAVERLKGLDLSFGLTYRAVALAAKKVVPLPFLSDWQRPIVELLAGDAQAAVLPPPQGGLGRKLAPAANERSLVALALTSPATTLDEVAKVGPTDLLRIPFMVQQALLFEAWRVGHPSAERLERQLAGFSNFPRQRHFILSGELHPSLAQDSAIERAQLWLARGRFLEAAGEDARDAYQRARDLDVGRTVVWRMLERWPRPEKSETVAWRAEAAAAHEPTSMRGNASVPSHRRGSGRP